MKLKVNYNVASWAQTYQEDVDATDAIVFPFRRGQAIKLVHSDNKKEHDPMCLQSFIQKKPGNESLMPLNKEEKLMRKATNSSKKMPAC